MANEFIRPNSISPYPEIIGYTTSVGEESELVFITQIMLNALRLHFELPHVPISGVYDPLTESAVKEFQSISGLDVTGEIDTETWNRLAEEYDLTVNDNQ